MNMKAKGNSKKNLKNIIILGAVAAILLGLLFFRVAARPEPPKNGAKIVVICTSCKAKFIKRIVNIDDDNDKRNYCDKCGGRLSVLWKCDECQFEFPEPKLKNKNKKFKNKVEMYNAVMNASKCPNCGSILSHPVTINEFKKEQKKKK